MKSKLLAGESEGSRVFLLVFDTGDEAASGIETFSAENRVATATVQAIGAFSRATVAWFSIEEKEYKHIPVDEQVEVLSLLGNLSLNEGRPRLHVHATLGKSDGATVGGHLLEGYVRPTLEVYIIESPGKVERKINSEVGLPLISL